MWQFIKCCNQSQAGVRAELIEIASPTLAAGLTGEANRDARPPGESGGGAMQRNSQAVGDILECDVQDMQEQVSLVSVIQVWMYIRTENLKK